MGLHSVASVFRYFNDGVKSSIARDVEDLNVTDAKIHFLVTTDSDRFCQHAIINIENLSQKNFSKVIASTLESMRNQRSFEKYKEKISLRLDLFLKTNESKFIWVEKQIRFVNGEEDGASRCSQPLEREAFLAHYEKWQKASRQEVVSIFDDQGQFV